MCPHVPASLEQAIIGVSEQLDRSESQIESAVGNNGGIGRAVRTATGIARQGQWLGFMESRGIEVSAGAGQGRLPWMRKCTRPGLACPANRYHPTLAICPANPFSVPLTVTSNFPSSLPWKPASSQVYL